MDEAARRVRPADLARLAALRERREADAARAARAAAERRRAAEAAEAGARQEVLDREAAQARGERAVYAGLTAGGAIPLAALEERRAALAALGETVEAARAQAAAEAEAASGARAAQDAALAVLARRGRETRKWERARGRILDRRRSLAERADEREAEDEILMRLGRPGDAA
ncbi:hypothetical protein ACQVP2_23130 [Methylobacterium aquaticum]|uniref:hypothetical protein n=1 Tax=Methylobacterium aquaticum TaxID=270351 RepID=UPI00069F7F95|nr:hypothetical protein [Methylobacterium aquaticum]